MKFLSPSFASTLLAAVTLFCLNTANLTAAPADEISRAVSASGASNLAAATPAQFVKAFSATLTRVKDDRLPQYVTAAIGLRPDLAPQITAAAFRAHRYDSKDSSCNWVDPIVRAAIAAAPDAKAEIVRAALEADPAARECIFAAAGMRDGGTQTAFFRPAGVDAGNINSASLGTINPGNFSGQGNVQSGNQERVTICHNGETLTLPRPAAEAHIRNHSGDRLGPCQ